MQRAVNVELRQSVGGQLSPGDRHLRPRHPPAQHTDSGPAGQEGAGAAAAAVRDPEEERPAPDSHLRLPRVQLQQEKSGEGEALH